MAWASHNIFSAKCSKMRMIVTLHVMAPGGGGGGAAYIMYEPKAFYLVVIDKARG